MLLWCILGSESLTPPRVAVLFGKCPEQNVHHSNTTYVPAYCTNNVIIPSASLLASYPTATNMHTHDQLSRQKGKLQCTNIARIFALPLWDRFHFVPLLCQHEITGRVTIGFAERSNIQIILSFVYFGV